MAILPIGGGTLFPPVSVTTGGPGVASSLFTATANSFTAGSWVEGDEILLRILTGSTGSPVNEYYNVTADPGFSNPLTPTPADMGTLELTRGTAGTTAVEPTVVDSMGGVIALTDLTVETPANIIPAPAVFRSAIVQLIAYSGVVLWHTTNGNVPTAGQSFFTSAGATFEIPAGDWPQFSVMAQTPSGYTGYLNLRVEFLAV